MDFLAAEAGAEHARTHWLIRLRWLAVLGVLGTLLVADHLLEMLVAPWPLYVLVAFLAVWNLWLTLRERTGRLRQPAGAQVAIDLLVLTGLLLSSGGLRNPFAVFLVVQILLGAILLPRNTALVVALAGVVVIVFMGTLEGLGLMPRASERLDLGPVDAMPVWAIAMALTITIIVAVWFVSGLMEDLRRRSRDARRFHHAVERERGRLRDVMRHIGAALCLLDDRLGVQWLNDRARRLLGDLPRGERFRLPGEPEDWPRPEDVEGPGATVREWRGRGSDGRVRVHHVSASAVRDRGGELEQVVVVLTDITDRRAAEMQLQRTEKLAALGRLAAGLAHEINNPLGSLAILVSEARDSLPAAAEGDRPARDRIEDYLQDIEGETARMSELVKKLLELGHPGSDTISSVDLSVLASDAVRLVSMRSRVDRARLETELAEDLPLVHVSPDGIRQVALNLLDNALDAARTTGGRVRVRTAVEGGSVVLEIEDEGEGIAPENLDRVFEPFFTTKEVGEGTGLGLYVSYEIVKNLGGDIALESAPGRGTRIVVSLPRVPGRTEPAPEIA